MEASSLALLTGANADRTWLAYAAYPSPKVEKSDKTASSMRDPRTIFVPKKTEKIFGVQHAIVLPSSASCQRVPSSNAFTRAFGPAMPAGARLVIEMVPKYLQPDATVIEIRVNSP